MSEKLFELLENIIIDVMRQARLPGLAIGVVKEGDPIYAKGFGTRDLEKNLPMDPDTLFGIGSITKSFTSLSIMQLVEQGKIDLQEPVKNYINFKLGDKKSPIKIRHLLSHSSGMPELNSAAVTIERGIKPLASAFPLCSWEDYLLHVNGAIAEKFDDPDKYFFYNNDMFVCLGLIIEKISNLKYEDYVRKNVLIPLGMNRSTFLKEEFDKDDNVITGYIPSKDGKSLEGSKPPFNKLLYAPGGLLSSIKEMQNYMIALMNDGTFNENQIAQQSSIEQMWSPQIKIPEGTAYGQGEASYGFGWVIDKDFFGHRLIHHGGNITTSSAFLAMIPDLKIGVVAGVNCEQSGILDAIVRGLLAVLLGKNINEAVPLLVIQKKLQALTGKYESYKGVIPIEILLENGILYAKVKMGIFSEPITFPLATENLDELKFYIPIAFPNQTVKVQFFIDKESGNVDAIADRYYFHKIK